MVVVGHFCMTKKPNGFLIYFNFFSFFFVNSVILLSFFLLFFFWFNLTRIRSKKSNWGMESGDEPTFPRYQPCSLIPCPVPCSLVLVPAGLIQGHS